MGRKNRALKTRTSGTGELSVPPIKLERIEAKLFLHRVGVGFVDEGDEDRMDLTVTKYSSAYSPAVCVRPSWSIHRSRISLIAFAYCTGFFRSINGDGLVEAADGLAISYRLLDEYCRAWEARCLSQAYIGMD